MQDSKFRKAVREAALLDLEELPDEKELRETITFSKEFEKEMENIFQYAKKQEKKYIYIGYHIYRKTAVAAIIAIILVSTTISVEAFREPIIKIFMEIYDKFSDIIFDAKDTIKFPEAIETVYKPSWVPEGYELTSEENNRNLYTVIYTNDKGDAIIFDQWIMMEKSKVMINTEGIETEDIFIEEYKGIYYEQSDLHILIWEGNEYIFEISSNLSKEVIIQIAKEIK